MKDWFNISTLENKDYICGYCGSDITSNKGFCTRDNLEKVYICHKCNGATFFNANKKQTPGYSYGKEFKVEIPDNVNILYTEARKCYSVGAYSANENLKFVEYVDFLDEENYIPKNSKKWVDIIRTKGNETTHEIKISDENEARQLIKFIEIIITLIYEIELEIGE